MVLGAALLVVAAAAAVYPIAGTASWLRSRDEARRSTGPPGRASALSPGADAEALFRALEPGDAAVAGWLERHAGREDVVLEETGDAYTWSSRIATFSGVPTILGWGNHEAGWRDDWRPIEERRKEIEAIYRNPASEQARELLRRHRVVWIVVGRRERERYGFQGSGGFEAVGEKRLEVGGTALFRLERITEGHGR